MGILMVCDCCEKEKKDVKKMCDTGPFMYACVDCCTVKTDGVTAETPKIALLMKSYRVVID